MNNQSPFWLRFSFFLVVFAVGFFLIIFAIEDNPFGNLKMLLIKVGGLAALSSLLYNIMLESDPEVVE